MFQHAVPDVDTPEIDVDHVLERWGEIEEVGHPLGGER